MNHEQPAPYDREEKKVVLNEAFSPSSPILAKDFFSGRLSQIDDVVDSINERGQHAIVYGERGVGKTSFANIIGNDLYGVVPVKVTCGRNDSFRSIWEKAFAKVRFEKSQNGIGFIPSKTTEEIQLDFFLPENQEITCLDVQQVLEHIDSNLLFIFDEYDSVSNEDVLGRMADTIKALSDNAPRVTLMLVGIAENVTELIGTHPSNERCLRQVQIPKMSDGEIHLIIKRGLEHLGFQMDETVKENIVKMALGFPHFAHLLAKQTCRAAIEDLKTAVGPEQYTRGLQSSLGLVDQSSRAAYQLSLIHI